MITPIGSVVKKQINGIIISFDDKTNIKLNTVNMGDNIAKLAYEGEKLMLNVSSNNSTDTFTAYATYTSKGEKITDEALNIVGKSAGKYEVVLASDADKNTNIQIKVINDGTQEVFYSNVLLIGAASSSDGGANTKDYISKTESYIGKYADLDGDGAPDGIIFADLAESKNGQWYGSYSTYSYSAVSNLKDYTISENKYSGAFGEAEIISVVNGSSGNDRFYIMALEDFITDTYSTWYWYYSAYLGISNYTTIVSNNFGTSKQNTATMISKWNSSAYGSQNAQDIWGAIQDKADDGWFVPSRAEWAAFAANLGITNSNYSSKGLFDGYRSSSLYDSEFAYGANFARSFIYGSFFNNGDFVRLAKTF